jgi:DNA-binding MarR family transcriptional regulator
LRRALADLAAPRGLSDTECLILWACRQAPAIGQPQHDLAMFVGISPAQMSGLLERLAERGWIAGRRPPRDRRRQYWRLLPEGEVLLAAVMLDLTQWSTRFAASLSEAQRTSLVEQLQQCNDMLQSSADGKEAA